MKRVGLRALGVRTTVSGVALSPINGRARIFGLEIENPAGFDAPHFLTLGNGSVSLDPGTIRSDPIEISQIRLQQVDLELEKRDGRLNTDAILDHVKGGSSSAAAEPDDSGASGPSVVVRELLIEDITAHVELTEAMGEYDAIEVKIPMIRLTDIGSSEPGGSDLSDLTDIVVAALLRPVAQDGVGLPLELTHDLIASLGGLGSQVGISVVGEVTGGVVDVTGRVLKTTTGTLEAGATGLKRAGEALGDLIDQEE